MNAVEELINELRLKNTGGGGTHAHEAFAALERAFRLAVEQRDKFAELHYGEHWKSKGIQSFMRLSQDAALIAAAKEAKP